MDKQTALQVLPQLDFANKTADEVVQLMDALHEYVDDVSMEVHIELVKANAYSLGILLALMRGQIASNYAEGSADRELNPEMVE